MSQKQKQVFKVNDQKVKKAIQKPFAKQIIECFYKTPLTASEVAEAVSFPKDKIYYHIKKLIAEENNIDFEINYMIYQLLGERFYLKTAYDQVKEREDVLDTNLREKFYNYPTPKAIIEEWQMIQS